MESYSIDYHTMRGYLARMKIDHLVPWAIEKEGLDPAQAEQAINEYRHFMYLIWFNDREGHEEVVVPTRRADAIWHAHLIDNYDYGDMCQRAIGRMVYHNATDYQDGSEALARATAHTQRLHAEHGGDGFSLFYLGVEAQRERREDGSATVGTTGGDSPHKAPGDDGSSSDGGSATDGGSAASCSGGAGCGAG